MATDEVNQICVVCCHATETWALGECNHPTCLLCCARLRVLCEQNECPVCRLNLKQVVVVAIVKQFQELFFKDWLSVQKYGLFFKTRKLLNKFNSIVDNRCPICPEFLSVRNFRKLREHVGKAHNLHYCDICVNNLKLFPSEFKMYSRPELTTHRREGDRDDSSYKGHPCCQFCDERYLDNDALHMHLRKNHFWCHFCESDGKQDYYKNYHFLRSHFREEHYLCEEGNCKQDILTSAFRNEIDLKAHRASTHSKGMSKAEVKQMRYVPVDFSYGRAEEDARRNQSTRGGGGGVGRYSRDSKSLQIREREEKDLAVALSASLQQVSEKPKKTVKAPSSQVKKKVCAQKDPEPPPGFVATSHDKENDFINKDSMESADEHGSADKDDPPGKELNNESWPSLSEPDSWPSLNRVEEPQGLNIEAPPGFIFEAPPGYSKILHSAKPPSSKNTTVSLSKPPSSTSSKERTRSPPLSSSQISLPPFNKGPIPITSSKDSKNGGSKIFEEIRRALDYDKDKFKEFQSLSGWFRNGDLQVKDYVSHCVGLFGEQWTKVGPQFAKAMPSGEKKEQLIAYFGTSVGEWGVVGGKRKDKRKSKSNSSPNVWISVKTESGSRTKVLSEEDYPSLSATSRLPTPKVSCSAWKVPIHS